MNVKTFELQLIQLEEIFSKSRNNIYSDDRKQEHFNELNAIFGAISSSDYHGFKDVELSEHVMLLGYISSNLEYLDNSTLNVIPFEMVHCLECALNEWVDGSDFIVATSLSNKQNEFLLESRDSKESFLQINNYLLDRYNKELSHRLIRIVLPKALSRDYLSSVVLYHELGHFIDFELNISKKLFLQKHLRPDPLNELEYKEHNHNMEYFADLFAAQYVGDSSNRYLNHIAHNSPGSITHPSTQNRISVVDLFLEKKACKYLNDFNHVLEANNSPKLEQRYVRIEEKKIDLEKLIPQKLETEKELHYLFLLCWDLWDNSDNNFLAGFERRQKYKIVNNLIEKSISNHIIKETWAKSSTRFLD